MSDQYAVIITKPGHDTVRIGPFHWSTEADSYRAMINQQLTCTAHPEGTHAASGLYAPELPHTALLPDGPFEIAELMDEGLTGEPEARFPDLYTRLVAQYGYDRSTDLWMSACRMYDAMNTEEEPEPVADQPTYYLAEYEGVDSALYSTADLARAHCEDLARIDRVGTASFDWMPEQDGVSELVWTDPDTDRPLSSTSGRVLALQLDAEAAPSAT